MAKAKEECTNANAKRLAAEVAAAKALKELEALAIQSKKDQALISDTDSKAKELQAEIEKAVLGVMTLSSESKARDSKRRRMLFLLNMQSQKITEWRFKPL